ncbi:hypothetical protein LDL59_14600 [Kaistella anthropi]|nr:hypothetical protein [Kaistella anthropi]
MASYSCNKSAEGNKNVVVEETSDIQVENKNGTVDTTVSIQKRRVMGKNPNGIYRPICCRRWIVGVSNF